MRMSGLHPQLWLLRSGPLHRLGSSMQLAG